MLGSSFGGVGLWSFDFCTNPEHIQCTSIDTNRCFFIPEFLEWLTVKLHIYAILWNGKFLVDLIFSLQHSFNQKRGVNLKHGRHQDEAGCLTRSWCLFEAPWYVAAGLGSWTNGTYHVTKVCLAPQNVKLFLVNDIVLAWEFIAWK